MTDQPTIAFNDGRAIPQLGFGVWRTPDADAADVVATALKAGYRHIDTASAYNNERGVGEGLRKSGLDRNEVFVTTKLKNDDQGYDAALRAFDQSQKRLGLDEVDLYLIHWPLPRRDTYVDSWKALIRLREEGRVRSIGVSNFTDEHLERVASETGVVPALNQIELHPRFQQREMRAADAKRNVVTESWSPLGQGGLLDDPTLRKIADKHGRTAAQVIIRWHLDNGLVVIPKSATPSRIESNFDVFGFALDADDRAAIDGMDAADGRIGPDPVTADF